MGCFEVVHCLDKHSHAFDGQCVVQGGSESANTAVSLYTYDAAGFAEIDE